MFVALDRAAIALTGLRASANGVFGGETFQQPKWAFEVRTSRRKELGASGGNFATVGCTQCNAAAGDLHEYTVDFVVETPESTELVIWAQHQSSQCLTEVYAVEVEVDYVRITAVR